MSDSSKHTPWPWRVHEFSMPDGITRYSIHARSQRKAIARTNQCGDWEIDEANARLIAAAPEMYEILLDLVNGKSGCLVRADELLSKLEGTSQP